MRKPIVVGNWKMNKTVEETTAFINDVDALVSNEKADFGIAVPYLDLPEALKAKNLLVAAENCHYEDHGAFTGEVSAEMLQHIGVQWCILGHSERRTMFNESDETVNLKVKKLLSLGMHPIVCIGENEQEFEKGETASVLRGQLHGSLKDLTPEQASTLVVAYEPIWAIGTGKSADAQIAENCCHTVRTTLAEMFGDECAQKIRIQYGGSVKAENIATYLQQEDIDGALIGGASLKPESFIAIMNAVA